MGTKHNHPQGAGDGRAPKLPVPHDYDLRHHRELPPKTLCERTDCSQTIAPSLDVAIIRDKVLDSALALVNDPIPNIRFNVAKALETLAVVLNTTPEGQEIAQRRIVPEVLKLQEDADADVRYYASKALERTQGQEPMGG